MRIIILIIGFVFQFSAIYAQKQLILLKNERVLLRLNPGDEIIFSLDNSDRVWKTYVNNIFDTTYWIGAQNYLRLFPGAPRNFMLTATYKF